MKNINNKITAERIKYIRIKKKIKKGDELSRTNYAFLEKNQSPNANKSILGSSGFGKAT